MGKDKPKDKKDKKDKKEKKGKKDKKKKKKSSDEASTEGSEDPSSVNTPEDPPPKEADPSSLNDTAPPHPGQKQKKLSNKDYEKELRRLQVELVKLQEWVKAKGLKVVVVFEDRDAAGKGGVIKRTRQCLNPRFVRVVALFNRSSYYRTGVKLAPRKENEGYIRPPFEEQTFVPEIY